ncbi:MAG: CpsD/CapB family tyrosine-protein kinase [Bryobacteraceae bacterium]|nr:CpsD/CapB family tyrosine-protein kinase [Bryobacteraceae bacterium]
MSRVHDALRRAEQLSAQGVIAPGEPAEELEDSGSGPLANTGSVSLANPQFRDSSIVAENGVPTALGVSTGISTDLLRRARQVPFTPSADSHLIDIASPRDAPAEEFRSLRTRLNHMQSLQPIHTVVVTSASPAEGKSFAAVNLAIAESQIEGNNTLLVDCDFRRPIVHSLFGIPRSPGMTDYLQGKARLEDCLVRIADSDLYVLPAGEAVVNPLELLNLREMRVTLEQLPRAFNWVILDSPPLLFAADANLLSTMSTGVILVVRIGTTTVEAVTRAMQSLCEDNVLGIVVNGARRGELYSKYTYYHSYYYANPEEAAAPEAAVVTSDK